MTYNILQEIEIMADNKSRFEFNQKDYNKDMNYCFEEYEEAKDLTRKAQLLCYIAIDNILLVGNNIGFEKIESTIGAARIRNEASELDRLKKLVAVMPSSLSDELSAKTNIKSLLRTVSGLVEFNKKNFRQTLRDKIITLLA